MSVIVTTREGQEVNVTRGVTWDTSNPGSLDVIDGQNNIVASFARWESVHVAAPCASPSCTRHNGYFT